jgi:hypothetical protein
MTSIFLSYARDDDELFVSQLYHDLVAHGFEVWWDRISMPNRKLTFNQEIRDAITYCDCLVLIAGPRAFASDYVVQEWKWAHGTGKPMYSLFHRNTIYKRILWDLIPEGFGYLSNYYIMSDAYYEQDLSHLIQKISNPARSTNYHQ